MKKVLMFLIFLNLTFVSLFLISCSNSKDNTSQNNYDQLDPASRKVAESLDKIFATHGKYKCEYTRKDAGGFTVQTLFIDNENFRAIGFSHPKSGDPYNVVGNVTSNIIGIVKGESSCTYMWSTAENSRGVRKDKVTRVCSKSKPPKPFSINDLMSGAFLGVTSELIDECYRYYGPIDLSIPTDREFFDITNLQGEDNILNQITT